MVEVLISGAGPAGASAALTLARRGVRVLLVERARLPHASSWPVALGPQAFGELCRLGVEVASSSETLELAGLRIKGPRADVLADFTEGHSARVVPSHALGRRLVEAAVAAGAQVHDGVRVAEPLFDRGIVRGAVLMVDGRRVRVPAVVTIAAEGRDATLARALGLVGPRGAGRARALAGVFSGVRGLTSHGELHLRRGHHVRVTPLPDGTAAAYAAGVHLPLSGSPARRLLDFLRAHPGLDGRFADARPVDDPRLVEPLRLDVPIAGTDGLLLAGDTAGTPELLGGNGVRCAVHGGALSAEVATAMLEDGRLRGHVELTRRRRAAFGHRWAAIRRLRALLEASVGVRAGDAALRWGDALARAVVTMACDLDPEAPPPRILTTCRRGPAGTNIEGRTGELPTRAQDPW